MAEAAYAVQAAYPLHQAVLHQKQIALVEAKTVLDNSEYRAFGVRPNITHAGDDLYICVCEREGYEEIGKEAFEIVAIYTGSPFTQWDKVIAPPPGGTLRHVRPVMLTEQRLVLFGVYEQEAESLDTVPKRYAAILDQRATILNERDTTIPWQLLSEIPIDYHNKDLWDISVYGDCDYVGLLKKYPSPPPSVIQRRYADDVDNRMRDSWY